MDQSSADLRLLDDAAELVATRGSLTIEEFLHEVAALGGGDDYDPEFVLEDLLEDDDYPLVMEVGADRIGYLPTLFAGRWFTHDVSAAEVAGDYLLIRPDLQPLDPLVGSSPFNHLDHSSDVDLVFGGVDDTLIADRGVEPAAVEHGAWWLTPGTFATRGIGAGDRIAVQVVADGFTMVRLTDEEIATGNAAAPAVAAQLAHDLAAQGEERPTLVFDVVAQWCADTEHFTTPLAPWGTVLQLAGCETFGDWIAPAGFDVRAWSGRISTARIRESYVLPDWADVESVATLAQWFRRAQPHLVDLSHDAAGVRRAVRIILQTIADQWAPDDTAEVTEADIQTRWHDARSSLRRATDALADQALAEPLLLETIGTLRRGVDEAALFFAALASETGRQVQPALHWLRGKCLERGFQIAAAESAYDEALRLDPGFRPALFEAARYASDRGQAQRGLDLLQRAEVGPDDHLVQLLTHFLPAAGPSLGRNDRCWCGSGRKFKVCHLGRAELPLEERCAWLYQKAGEFASEPPWRGLTLELATIRSAYWPGEDARWEALNDPLVGDLVLFEGGAFDEFVRVRGHLLPADELLLAEQWLLVARSVFEIEEVSPGDGLRVRDLLTGDRHEVRERSASRQLRRGELFCGRVVPAGERHQIFGGVEMVDLRLRDPLLDLLSFDDPDPHELVELLSARFAPPTLQTTEGETLVSCLVGVTPKDPAAFEAKLHSSYEFEGGCWREFVPQSRTVRATIEWVGEELQVSTMSVERLMRVLETFASYDLPFTRGEIEQAELPGPPSQGMAEAAEDFALDMADNPDLAAALDAYILDYEKQWLDTALPALAGLTPRQAADDPTRRPDLERLLDSFPQQEAPGSMSVTRLRAALGLPPRRDFGPGAPGPGNPFVKPS